MSLQVWLPLTKDLRQQGLSDMTVTNNGATFDSSGKLGGCYSFNGSSNYVTLPQGYINNNWSYALWVYTSASTTQTLGCCRTAVGTGFSIFLSNTGKIRIDAGISSTSSQWTVNYTFPINTWFHLAITANNNEIKYYINGNYQETHTVSTAANQWGNIFSIGASQVNGSNYGNYLKGKLNDVRIYDHCLSSMEVKQLSQGLVLHYSLSDNSIQQLNNCYTNPTFNSSSAGAGWSHWGSSGHKGTYGQNTDSNYIYREGQSYSHWVADGADATKNYLVYQGPAFEGGQRSLQCICKEENGLPINESIVYPAWNARNGGTANNQWTSITSLGNGFYHCKCEDIQQSGSDDLVGFYVQPGYKVYFSEAYLENDKECCSDIFYPTTTIYDCSGFCNNGTISGALTVSNDTPKYKVSTHFSSAQIKRDSLEGEIKTLACWVKTTANKSTSQFVVADYNSNMCISFYSGCIIGVFGTTRGTGSKSTLGNSYKENDWNHIVVVKTGDAGERAIYCNGVLLTPTTNDYWSNAAGFLVSGRNTSNTLPMQGYISDVRAYATALSASDVKSLYQNSAYIDNSGNIYGAVHMEV